MPLNVTLASSLLDLEAEHHRNALEVSGRVRRIGIDALDKAFPETFLRGGDVVGIGGDGRGNEIRGELKTGSIPLEIIINHLMEEQTNLRSIAGQDHSASVFIIAPPSLATNSIQRVYAALNARLNPYQRQTNAARAATVSSTLKTQSTAGTTPSATAKDLLNHISLLQYLDISGLAESVSEVLDVIQSQRPPATITNSPRQSILLVQGLTTCVNSTQRRSGLLQTAALLSSILQSLRNVTRASQELCLVLVETDIVWSAVATAAVGASRPDSSSGASPISASARNPGAIGMRSAFSSKSGKILRTNTGDVFGKLIEDGMDVLVAVHDGDGKVNGSKGQRAIIECIRDERVDVDREENALGVWTVWE